MLSIDPSLRLWGWFFLIIYIGGMLGFGFVGMRRVRNSDDFATARGSYGPLFLAFALTATTASGGTFLGLPALAYETGFSALWYAFMYSLATYLGLIVCLRGIRRAGESFGTRSMPEYLVFPDFLLLQSHYLVILFYCKSHKILIDLSNKIASTKEI